MKGPVVVKVEILHIINKFDVRKSLDDDRILQFAELIQNGAEFPPITVIQLEEGGYAFVDGRHRAAAYALLNLTEIPAIIKPEGSSSVLALFAEALAANYGGAKPPTSEDIRHTVTKLIEAGEREASIRKALHFIPLPILRRYLSDASSTLKKRRIREALDAIAGGVSIPDAAKRYKIEEGLLRDAIAGRKRQWGSSGEASLLAESVQYVNTVLRSANTGIGKKVQALLGKVGSGELSPEVVEKVLDAWATKLNGATHRIKDWKERLNASVLDSTVLDREEIDG
jgi:ParB-like chromosome segregation protein Spo0J